MLNGPPILAPGGGAEVLPAGLLDSPNSLASSWFANNGFAPQHSASSGCSPCPSPTVYDGYHSDTPQYSIPNCTAPFATNVNPYQGPLFPDPPPQISIPSPYSSDLIHASSSHTTPSANLLSGATQQALTTNHIPLTAPSALGLPVYSSTGFDVLSVLSRISNRPNPTIHLGPVDLSCSFAIADVRRHDCPIVYASPTFYRLTGYDEHEVLGRNCRFLQSPSGNVSKGEPRRFASPEAVGYMRKSIASFKECQTSLINYRKGGQAFINLVTVIPLRGGVHNTAEESDNVVYLVGFQVDLTDQPKRILEKLRDGTYCVDHESWVQNAALAGMGARGRHGQMMNPAVSKELRDLIADTRFTDSVVITTGTNISGGGGSSTTAPLPLPLFPTLSLLLLEVLPDFLLVLSLKGAFLYVAPSVRLVLGYEPHELVGKSISDVCHPADLVPLMRELKEGSSSGGVAQTRPQAPPSHPSPSVSATAVPRNRTSAPPVSQAPYVWLECRGRLHVEPGKGRKAIILSGRARWMPVVKLGSSSMSIPDDRTTENADSSPGSTGEPREFWALLSSQGTVLVASAGVRDVLGWGAGEVIGRNIWGMMGGESAGLKEQVEAELGRGDTTDSTDDPPLTILTASLAHKDTGLVPVRLVIYRTPKSQTHMSIVDASARAGFGVGTSMDVDAPLMHSSDASLFEELDTSRGSSWQYELQQLRFANQRLLEELNALEGVAGGSGAAGRSSMLGVPPASTMPLPSSSSGVASARIVTHSQPQALALPLQPQNQTHYAHFMHPIRPSDSPFQSQAHTSSLHTRDPPTSDWSSLKGAHGPHVRANPLKRTWGSGDGPTGRG
ncbi:hypothetical protein HYDPIDRAFT_101687 [Hydnomerulius pinastri MD-312]|uniref:Unplaced genomic scaffold scaffold_69, whole genome shotgun sequence n=1 Tax=Hydnomerulius pinastri MD-312 TaxID=994086 RepID=A0A0C9VMR8_9AGAM|nr:hypothetical protein HYDPIDRAFT_101687 [Hydnomerulius pinastri MD-312]